MNREHVQQISSSIIGTVGVSVSVQDLTQIVNLILLVLSVINILWVLGFKIYERIKKKDLKNVSQDINEAIDDLEKLKNKEGE